MLSCIRGRVLLYALAATLVCAAFPAIASADGGGPGTRTVVIGPIRAHHGFNLTVTGYGCSTRHPSVALTYTRGGSRAMVIHSYVDPAAKQVCSVTRKLGAGRLRVRWGSMLRVGVRFIHAGRGTRPARVPGCHVRGGMMRDATAVGTIVANIHSKVFGRLHVRRANVAITRAGTVRCSPPKRQLNLEVATGTGVNSFMNMRSLYAVQPARGRRTVVISAGIDNPGRGIDGSVTADLVGGSSLFRARSNLSSAQVGASRPLLTGRLSFRGLPACPGHANAVNGTVTGSLVLHDPVLGRIVLGSAHVFAAFLARGSGIPGTCNGPAAIPARPSFSDGCEFQSVCSVSGGTNTVTFQDTSSAGSVGITGETWSFGDGSAPAVGTVGGTVKHTYAAGTYTVTLTITTGGGQRETATGQVYIGS